jgi:hypothetical protein
MQPDLNSNITVPQCCKPILNSYDSLEECSLNHWIELCRMLDESERPELEEPVELAASEV